MSISLPRDLIGYGLQPPDPQWPGGAKLALNFVLNYEEGGERSILNGDPTSEAMLADSLGLTPLPGLRNLNVESVYEYGSRVGVWRILKLFARHGLPITLYVVGRALEQNPALAEFVRNHETIDVVAHGWRWIDYLHVSIDDERAHIRRCVASIEAALGKRPIGWYCGRPSLNTRGLVVEEGGFLYDCDAYNDDLPYWTLVDGKPHLIICHTLDTNDTRLNMGYGLDASDDWCAYMCSAVDWLYAEGSEEPRFLTIGLHCRLVGRPGRMAALERLLGHVERLDHVWICNRDAVARHWIATQPYRAKSLA
jgi:allantoinase